MNIAISLDKNFINVGYVMLTSLFMNHKESDVSVYVLYRGLEEGDFLPYHNLAQKFGKNLYLLNVPENMIPSSLPVSDKWPSEIYFRLALPYLLPDEERILYLDTDIIINNDLSELYNLPFNNLLFYAAPDNSDGNLSEKQCELFGDLLNNPDFHYANSGVLLMNLEGIRNEFKITDITGFIEKNRRLLTAFDQDTINYLLNGRIGFLPHEKYNLFARLYHNSGYTYDKVREKGTCIIHYTGPKPWSGESLRTDMEKFWWEYAKETPYYHEFMEQSLFTEMNKNYENTNEFLYQLYLLQEAENREAALREREKEYISLLNESSALLEKLGIK